MGHTKYLGMIPTLLPIRERGPVPCAKEPLQPRLLQPSSAFTWTRALVYISVESLGSPCNPALFAQPAPLFHSPESVRCGQDRHANSEGTPFWSCMVHFPPQSTGTAAVLIAPRTFP